MGNNGILKKLKNISQKVVFLAQYKKIIKGIYCVYKREANMTANDICSVTADIAYGP